MAATRRIASDDEGLRARIVVVGGRPAPILAPAGDGVSEGLEELERRWCRPMNPRRAPVQCVHFEMAEKESIADALRTWHLGPLWISLRRRGVPVGTLTCEVATAHDRAAFLRDLEELTAPETVDGQ